MKVCLIGATGHINYVFGGLAAEPEAQLIGIAPGSAGERTDKAATAAERGGFRLHLYQDYRKMLDELKPDIAAVTPYFCDHARIAGEVLERGIPVFVEKPVATTFVDLAMLREVHARSGAQLAAMFGIRYAPAFLTAWHAVRDGAIGAIRLMHAQKSYRLGKRDVPYLQRQTYGGTIPWVGSHAIDWLRWFSGEAFESVFASHSARDNRGHGELEMSAACHFTLSNGVSATVNIDYLRPAQAPSHGDDRLRIAGSDGVIEVRDGRVILINGEQSGERDLSLMPKEEIFADFIRQVRGEGVCRVSAEDAFAVTEACLKARQSADERRLIYF